MSDATSKTESSTGSQSANGLDHVAIFQERTPSINMLPYRQANRQANSKRFLVFLGSVAVVAAILAALCHLLLQARQGIQTSRNEYLSREIKNLDKQIEEIKKLREDTRALISRKQVVEALQANRTRSVLLFNQVIQPPTGIQYKTISQKVDGIVLTGYAASNANVSTLIKQIETSGVLLAPQLVEIKAVTLEGQRISEFTINTRLINLVQKASAKGAPARPAAAPAPAPTPAAPAPAGNAPPPPAAKK